MGSRAHGATDRTPKHCGSSGATNLRRRCRSAPRGQRSLRRTAGRRWCHHPAIACAGLRRSPRPPGREAPSRAIRTSPRALRPSAPSSPTTFASTDASTTINGSSAPLRRPRWPARARHPHRAVARCDRAPRRELASLPGASARREDGAGVSGRVAQLAAEAQHGRHVGGHQRARLQYASKGAPGSSLSRDGDGRCSSRHATPRHAQEWDPLVGALEATVLHYGADFDRIGSVTGHRCQWAVPAGTTP